MRDAEESKSPKQNDSLVSDIQEQTEPSNHSSVTVNKIFVVNTLKQVDVHNRIKTNQDSKLLRKFQNEERKKHTLKNLDKFSAQKTLYSDFLGLAVRRKASRKRRSTTIITPLEQVKKIVIDAAEFDEEQENMLNRVVRKPRFSLDKTLLKNHLQVQIKSTSNPIFSEQYPPPPPPTHTQHTPTHNTHNHTCIDRLNIHIQKTILF